MPIVRPEHKGIELWEAHVLRQASQNAMYTRNNRRNVKIMDRQPNLHLYNSIDYFIMFCHVDPIDWYCYCVAIDVWPHTSFQTISNDVMPFCKLWWLLYLLFFLTTSSTFDQSFVDWNLLNLSKTFNNLPPISTYTKMSFLTRSTPLTSRLTVSSRFAPRAFSTSFVNRKSATETVKDAAKTVDRAVSDKIVDGIEVGRKSCSQEVNWRHLYWLNSPLAFLGQLSLESLKELLRDEC